MPIEVSINKRIIEAAKTDNLRSESVSEIISGNPGFLIRYGISIFFAILLLMVFACWFIQYPDLVSAPAKLTSINAPKPIITKTDGKLIQLNAKENDSVSKGEIIGYMESIANPLQIIALSARLDTVAAFLNKNQPEKVSKYFLPSIENDKKNLGELQQQYQIFAQAYTTFNNYLRNGFYPRKKLMLYIDKTNLQKLHENILQQKDIQTQDLTLSQKTFEANDTLKKQKVISALDYRNEKSKLLNKEISIPQINAALIDNEAQQNNKQKEILELENTIAQQQQIFEQALNTFISHADEWKKKYLLIAPVSGAVSYTGFFQQNQQMKANEIICYINPPNSNYYAEMVIPQQNFGKVKTGQQVLLKFKAYPDAEFGSVTGSIDFISRIPTDSGYLAKVSLPNGLNTNYKKQIQFRDGLIADGQIVTESMRLLQRFYYNIYRQIKR